MSVLSVLGGAILIAMGLRWARQFLAMVAAGRGWKLPAILADHPGRHAEGHHHEGPGTRQARWQTATLAVLLCTEGVFFALGLLRHGTAGHVLLYLMLACLPWFVGTYIAQWVGYRRQRG